MLNKSRLNVFDRCIIHHLIGTLERIIKKTIAESGINEDVPEGRLYIKISVTLVKHIIRELREIGAKNEK